MSQSIPVAPAVDTISRESLVGREIYLELVHDFIIFSDSARFGGQ